MASVSASRTAKRGKVRCVNVEFADNGVEFQQRHENSGMSFVPDPKPSVFNDEEAAVTYFRECLRKYATFEKEHEG